MVILSLHCNVRAIELHCGNLTNKAPEVMVRDDAGTTACEIVM
jgi:hypothetical protein